jgi:hypothetical protein
MELIAPDILTDVKQLSASLSVLMLVCGVFLWLAGWWSHRFWMVLAFTVLGGIWGLQNGAALQTQPLVAAIGVGLAAGILALTVVRLGAFAAGGYAGLLLIHTAVPTFDQPLLSFLAGGLLGFFLFRYWTMALTSLAGVVLFGYGALALADNMGKLNAVTWAESHTNMLNAVGGMTALAGFGIQLLVDWVRRPAGDESKGDKKEGKKSKPDGVLAGGLASFRKAS